MVRIASVSLILSSCVAEDVYYHTQLLQTKVNPQKVSIDTSGDVSPDETNLFQKAMQQTSSKKAAGAKLLKRLGKHLLQGKPRRGGGGGGGPPPGPDGGANDVDPEVAGTCMMLYGHDVDMGACGACYGEVAPHYDEEAMMEDPNAMVRTLADMADECMGTTNQITSVCEEHYGPEVPLFDCMMCGEICQCSMEGCAEPECHSGCMAGDEEGGAEIEDEGDCSDECQLFYGPDADPDQCEACGHQCMEEANGAVEELAMSGADVGMEDFETTWFNTLITCSDACMAPLVNLPEQACKAHYGPDVDLVACYTCGMMCGCDLEGNCEWCDHGECMTKDSSSSSWLQKSNMSIAAKNPHAPKAAFVRMQKRAKKAAAKKLRQLKQRRSKKSEAFGQLMKHKIAQKGRPGKEGKRGGKKDDSSDEPPCDAEVEGTCMMLYGHDVDMGACAACYGAVAPHYDEEAMMEDPNAMVRTLADMADECMGTTNQITAACEGAYGEDVLLFDCMMCGEICQCSMEGCDEACHSGCMAGDEEGGTATYDEGDCSDECQLFYGPEADPAQCEACGHQCFEEANGAVEEMMMSGDEAAMEDFERIWFETMISCSDACMAPLVNLPEQACKAHYGEDVDLVACYTCGMMCGCDLEGNCEWCDHGACMAGEYDYSSSDYSSSSPTWSSTSWSTLLQNKVVHPMHKSKALHKRFQAAMAKIKPEVSDVTDLMQTRKHLK